MAESVPTLEGLAVETVEWLPSGAESGLVRVRGRWIDEAARQPELPVLAVRAGGVEHRFDSLPDARFSREPESWRGTYLVPAELVASDPEALWLEWPTGARCGLPTLARGVEPPPVPPGAERPEPAEDAGGQVIDRAVLAERRARRAEAAERQQARVAAEALKAVEVLELRSAELERRLEEATAEREALAERDTETSDRREALAAALASAAALRSQARKWQLDLRANEVARAGDAVRLAVLESERASTLPGLRAALAAANREAAAARAALTEAEERLADERAAWDRRREDLEADLAQVRADIAQAREEAATAVESLQAALAAAQDRLRVETLARTTLEDELDRERAERAAAAALRAEAEALRIELTAARSEADTARAEAEAARSDADAARWEADALRSELQTARAEVAAGRAALDDLRAEIEAERARRHTAEAALREARRAGATLQDQIVELERRAASGQEELERLAREHAAAAAAREPAADSSRLVADLDAAADALRRRTAEPPAPAAVEPALGDASAESPAAAADPAAASADAAEPVAPDAEPATEVEAAGSWPDAGEPARAAVEPPVAAERPPESPAPFSPGAGVEAAAPDAEPAVEWSVGATEPCAPDAEPAVEWSDAVDGERSRERVQPGVEPVRAPTQASDVEWAPAAFLHDERGTEPPAPDAEPFVESVPPEPAPAGPRIVPASGPPPRALMIGSERREYPLLRGAIVKLAHDDPALAARVLAALLPAQGACIDGPLAYDLTLPGAGTFAIDLAGGRATVEALSRPRGRRHAEFHLTGDPLHLAELLAGVDHRIGRFFGPIRVRGRKRRVSALTPLRANPLTLTDAARAGARLDPELVYRTFAYAVHPSWTRGHRFTVAQAIVADPPETWYLTARDGAGLAVSTTPPPTPPSATVTMSRATFDRLLKAEPVPSGERPAVRGDRHAVDLLRSWTERAR